MQGTQQRHNDEVNVMEWCGYVLWESYTKGKKKKSPVRNNKELGCKVHKRGCLLGLKVFRKTLSLGSHSVLCLRTFLTKQHRYKLVVFEDKSIFSLSNTEETKVKNFEEQQKCGLQLNWGSMIMDTRRGLNGAEPCSCHISLGYQRKSSLGFYFEKALCLKYRIPVDVLAKNTTDLSSNMAAARLAHSPRTPLCLWVLWCLSSLPRMKDCMNWEHAKGPVSGLWQLGQFFTFQ